MVAILILCGLGLAGGIALVGYGLSMRHKVAAVVYEIGVVQERVARVPELISQLDLPAKRA
ncbi:MAG: hypothetical protein R2722_16845 [Tessaracoccus sp.]